VRIIIIIHLLGLAPAGYLAAPDNGAERRHTGGCSQVPLTGDGCLAVPLNAAESPVGRNLRGGKRSRSQFLEGSLLATHVSVCPEPPTPGRKPPALLALERVVIGLVASESAGLAAAFFPAPFFTG
jgi:hypothetical protein